MQGDSGGEQAGTGFLERGLPPCYTGKLREKSHSAADNRAIIFYWSANYEFSLTPRERASREDLTVRGTLRA
jgi:hypothetical protein